MFNSDINDIERNWLIAIGVFSVIVFLAVVIYPISIILTTGEWTDLLEKKYEYIIKVLTTAGLIFGGIVGCINIFFAAKRAYAMEESAKAANEGAIAANKNAEIALENTKIALKNLKISEDKQITERFAKAIEQLASEKIEVRLGAIYTLERIAKDSEKDQWTIMEVLTAFVRENAPIKKEDKSQNKKSFIDEFLNTQNKKETEKLPKLRLDIQECLTVIGRREHQDPSNKRLDLSNIDISKANLQGAKLESVNFTGAKLVDSQLAGVNLAGANLKNANLTQAFLYGADLFGTVLESTNFTKANLTVADLEGVNLRYANLEGANLQMTRLIRADMVEANLKEADLAGANLRGVHLTKADLTRSNFTRACMRQANLTGVNLTRACLREANLSEANLEGANLKGAMMPDGSIHD
jgi:uncharacterized protein YjbI with pentapeptide repeats